MQIGTEAISLTLKAAPPARGLAHCLFRQFASHYPEGRAHWRLKKKKKESSKPHCVLPPAGAQPACGAGLLGALPREVPSTGSSASPITTIATTTITAAVITDAHVAAIDIPMTTANAPRHRRQAPPSLPLSSSSPAPSLSPLLSPFTVLIASTPTTAFTPMPVAPLRCLCWHLTSPRSDCSHCRPHCLGFPEESLMNGQRPLAPCLSLPIALRHHRKAGESMNK